jgi:hypothetical protein
MDKKEIEFESSIVSTTDSMGREIWWEDAGRPEGRNQ